MPEPFKTSHHGGVYDSQRASLTIVCPKCGSPSIETKNHATRIGGVLGTCAGVMGSLSGAAERTSVGAAIACRATAPATPLVSITATILDALAGGAMGCATGAALGRVVDGTVLNNQLCHRCDHSFQIP